ncbi:hypothetical protein CIPAW_08G112000 [Carya illinoinensis]|uniref:Uncharacterized protein n=1 Tax=Carya illinoinensis TaxID=32201 RepID=A0A8T1PVC3_CARIL|nr:hypothetical protein CIPAW_08G112000 [Carya illinoinensis]
MPSTATQPATPQETCDFRFRLVCPDGNIKYPTSIRADAVL